MTTATRPWQGLRLDPLDVLFFRDGRPFDAASRVSGGLPNPQTFAGALRTALLARTGFDFATFSTAVRQEHDEAGKQSRLPDVKRALRSAQPNAAGQAWVIGASFRGPWLALARREEEPVEPLLPLPATLIQKDGGGWLRAEPRQPEDLPGWVDEKEKAADGLLPLWRKGKPDTKAGSGFLSLKGLSAFLARENFGEAEFFRPGDLYDFDNRTGIRIDNQTLTSAEGEIYGIRLLSLKPKVEAPPHIPGEDPYRGAKVCLYAEVRAGDGAPDLQPYLAEPIPLGGEGRYVRAHLVPACGWPTASQGQRALWYLATPAFLGPDPRQKLHKLLRLSAAASAAGMAVSGWDVARNGPRPTRFAVPAGAVYFVEGEAPAEGPFALDPDEADEGWGFALQGTW